MATLTWTYEVFSDDHGINVFNEVNNFLLSLSPSQATTAKVTVSDQKSGDARGLVYYVSNGDIPSTRTFMTGWTMQYWSTDSDYTTMYNNCLTQLNSMDADQSLASHVVFTNQHDNDSRIALFSPATSE